MRAHSEASNLSFVFDDVDTTMYSVELQETVTPEQKKGDAVAP